MKKKLVLMIAVLAVMVAALVACVDPDAVKSVELDRGSFPEVIELGENPDVSQMKLIVTKNDGSIVNVDVTEVMIIDYDISTVGQKTFTILYANNEVQFDLLVVAQKYFTVTFDSNGGSEVPSQEVFYGEVAEKPEDPKREGYEFKGWYLGQEAYDWTAPVYEDMTLVAHWVTVEEAMKELVAMFAEYSDAIVREKYSAENAELVDETANQYLGLIDAETDYDAAKALYEEGIEALNAIPTYADMILAYVAEMNAEEYFAEDWATIEAIADEAALAVDEYVGGAPTPEFIYIQAIEAIEAVFTKAEDIEIAEYEKIVRIREFKAYVAEFNALFYSEEGWKEFLATVEAGIASINEAEGTRAVVKAYLAAIEAVDAVETLSADKCEALRELLNAYTRYQNTEYFEEDWALLEAIYEEAVANIRAYVEGAPSITTICDQALAAMDKILTKAEDIEVAEQDKVIKIRALNAYVDALDEKNYHKDAWAEIQSLRTSGIAAINAAVGTRAVAAAYAEAYNAIIAIAPHAQDVIDALTALDAEFASYSEEDYFAEQWAEIVAIYEEAYEAICDYEAGAPTIETILHQAIEAMDKVVTKAEDIELAAQEKTKRIRELENYVAELVPSHYGDNWNTILTLKEEGIAAINAAVGTKAVAEAYAAAIEAIAAVEKLPEEVINAMEALVEAFEAYNEEDYFAEQWAELVAIYEEALEYIVSYEGGAPTVDYVVERAINDMDNVVTKAEDIEIAETEKVKKIRDLENLVESLDENDYTAENWKAILGLKENGIAAIKAAVGTKAVAEAYANAVAAIKAIEIVQGTADQIAAAAELDKAMEAFKEEDYFAEQWAEIQAIYAAAVEAIFEYEGGAPSLDKIVSDAIAAIEKVVTKAEDIELANTEKVKKIRDLEAYVDALIASGTLNEKQINSVNEAKTKGIELINSAVGTKAVADAYRQVIELINQLIG